MRDQDIVDRIEIATPCDRTWDSLVGGDAKRYCGDCKLNVYNFSAMSGGEVRELLETAEGRVCGRFFRRPDGSVLTKDCGPIRDSLRRRARRLRVAAAALFGLAGTFGLSACSGEGGAAPTIPGLGGGGVEQGPELLGEVCVDPAPATPASPTPTPTATPVEEQEQLLEELGDVVISQEMLGRIALPLQHPETPVQPPKEAPAQEQ